MSARRSSARRAPAAIPAHMLVPGYFTELIRRHNGPPMFESRIDAAGADARLPRGAAAIAHRERQAQSGIGWGSGTSVMPGTPGTVRPAWMVRSAA
jgi:hypothetical protein